MKVIETPTVHRIARVALWIACSWMSGLAAPVWAQTDPPVPEVFAPPAIPADWRTERINGITLRLPPDLTLLQDYSTEHVWGQMDAATNTGFALRIAFSDRPGRELERDEAVLTGALVLLGGQTFRTYFATAPAEADAPGDMEMLVSDLPMLGDERLMVALATMNRDIAEYRPLLAQVLGSMTLPPPGLQLQRDLLGGTVRLPIGPGWSGTGPLDTGDVYLFSDEIAGRVQIRSGKIDTGGMPTGTPGMPVLFLGQKAQLFAHEDGSETVEDNTGDTGKAGLIVLESCLPDGSAITLRFSGMPALFHDPSIAAMVTGGEIVMPEGSAPCPADIFPEGANLDSAAARAEIAPPFGVDPPRPEQPRASGAALGGLFIYTLPIGWIAEPGVDDQQIRFAKADGSAAIVLARGAALVAPAGPVAMVPPTTYHRSDIIFGWPSERYEWEGPGNPSGFQRLFIHSHCLAGEERFGMLVSGSRAFQEEGELSGALRTITLNMPDTVKPCPDPLLGIGTASAALPTRQEAVTPTHAAPPVSPGSSSVVMGQADWFGQVPSPALPSPATESLAGRWQKGTTFPSAVAMGGAATIPTAQPDTQGESVPVVPPAPPVAPVQTVESVDEPDRFMPGEGGYALFENGRYGTFISYPSGYFSPEPPPGNGDGRRFVSVDGAARFYVFAQFNALGQSQAEQIAQDKSDPAHPNVTYERSGSGWYVLSGTAGSDIYYRRVIEDMNGLIRVFEITYPAARKAEFDAVVTYMAKSFGPGTDMVTQQPLAVTQPPASATEPGLPVVKTGMLRTPERGTQERGAIIDAARLGAEQPLGRKVIFVVSALRTDGTWAYFQGRPVNPDGSALDWSRTPFAREISNGSMSDTYMALLLKQDGRWQILEKALGPTDVAWYNWLAPYGLPEVLFSGQ
ncbi:hypothetical protein EEB11_18735 [Pseudotabrizicola sediminis]|uniref:Uncharacterized protein n=1 Tax=Pseudotabrizicola sediminis TaxID=2486418 RepID=A0ABY2KIA1_9RHOB|nr:hypothetical protein [Pseudotabrizicola sediminis]TGD41392.1 hypothetical protein EEB11_18735 [Pseudotabrizicola sediminis]